MASTDLRVILSSYVDTEPNHVISKESFTFVDHESVKDARPLYRIDNANHLYYFIIGIPYWSFTEFEFRGASISYYTEHP